MSNGRENEPFRDTERHQEPLAVSSLKTFLQRITNLSNEQKYRLLTITVPIILFLIALFIRTYSTSSLYTWDEGWVSMIARKMLEDENWFVPVYFGEGNKYYLFDKPFFVFWFFCFSMTIFGFTSFASKLPLILAGSALPPLAYFLTKGEGNELKDIARGLIAGLLVAVAHLLVLYSRTAYLDPLVVFFGSLAALCAVKSVDQLFDDRYRSALAWLLVTAIVTCITILCKAWQGLVFLPAVGIYFGLKLWKCLDKKQEPLSKLETSQSGASIWPRLKYSLPGCLAAFLVFAVINLELFFLALIPAVITLFHSLNQSARLQRLYSSERDWKLVLTADFLGKTFVSIIPAITLKISLYGLTDAIGEVFSLLGAIWGLVVFQAFIALLSSLLFWVPLNWVYGPLEELIIKKTAFIELPAARAFSKFTLMLLPGSLLLSWGLILFWAKPAISPLSVTLLFTGVTLILFTIYTVVNLGIRMKRAIKWSLTGKVIFFEVTTVLLVFLAFIPLLAWIDWIDSANLGMVIRKSGEMARYPEVPIPDPLTYRWLFFEYYFGWRYSFGTVYTVIDSLGAFLDPLFLAGVPFFFAGLYYLWKQGQVERGFFFLTWFASVLFVFLPAQFQLNYYYYPAFLPYLCLVAVGMYETAMNNEKLRFSSVKSRILLSIIILTIQAVFLYLPLFMQTTLDTGYLLTVIVVITGGALAVTLAGRNVLEIIAGWVCVVAMHRFLVWSDPGILLAVAVVGGAAMILILSLVKVATAGFPARSLLIVIIVIFTGIVGAVSMMTTEAEIDLYPDRIASYIEQHAGTANYTCWAPDKSGFTQVLRYELGNPFIGRFDRLLRPFSLNSSAAVDNYIKNNPEIKIWILFYGVVDELEDVRQYTEAWNHFVNLPEIIDVSEEAGLPEGSISRLFANQTVLTNS